MIININSAREFHPTHKRHDAQINAIAIEPAVLHAATVFTQPDTHARDNAVQVHLRALRIARRMDGAFVILFDHDQQKVDRLIAGRFDCVVDDPQAIAGLTLPSNDLFAKRFAKQQIVGIADIDGCDDEFEFLQACLGNYQLKSFAVGGIVVRDAVVGLFIMGTAHSCNQWQFDTYLTMQLLAATYSAGLERYLTRRAYYGVRAW